MSTTARGQYLERLAKACLESRGWLVERAQNVVRWLPDKEDRQRLRPVSLHHDLFGRFDGVYVSRDSGTRGFYQVTTLDNFHARRAKILALNLGVVIVGGEEGERVRNLGGFPVGPDDLILAHRHRTRRFRVARGPLFLLADTEEWEAPAL